MNDKNNKKNNILLYLCILIFGIVGIYCTFFAGNTSRFDSETRAYEIYPNESTDSEGTIMYYPVYYFRANGLKYECKSKNGSSSAPDESKNIVYYDSANPENCMTQYEKSSSRLVGIICLIVTAIVIYFFIIKKPSNESNQTPKEVDYEKEQKMQEKAQKVAETVEKVGLIYKRVIIGIIILVLFGLTLFDLALLKQTIESRNFIETTATYVDTKGEEELDVEYIYTFTDNKGNQHEIIVSAEGYNHDDVKVKYNENNPQEFYTEGMLLTKSSIIWVVVKIIALILLICLFFNKKLLSKIGISTHR